MKLIPEILVTENSKRNKLPMSELFFSIIIPTYNRANFILKLVKCFLSQSYSNFELIIVDDGSTDNTKDVLMDLKDKRINYVWKQNGERGAARKFGADMAKGDYINYFDSDDIPYPNHLQTAEKIAREFKIPMVFHLGYELRNQAGNVVGRPTEIIINGNKKIMKGNYINPNPLFVHRSTLREVKYKDDRNLSGVEDWLYHLQLASRYTFVTCGDKITSCMIQHDNRSMIHYSGDEFLIKNELILKYLQEDNIFMNKYKQNLKYISAELITLAALHYVLEGKKIKSVKTFLQAFRKLNLVLFKRRTLAIIKYLVFNKKFRS